MKIINLSDLHYRKNWNEEVGLVFRKFSDDIKKIIDPSDHNVVIFSGDLVQSGGSPEMFDELFEKLDPLLNAVGVTQENRFLVPGNHDLDRTSIKSNFLAHKGGLKLLDNESLFNTAINGELESIISPKFKNYLDFESKFVASQNRLPSISGGGIALTEDTGIYLMNSALASHGGMEDVDGQRINDYNTLQVDTRSLHAWIESTEFTRRILVLHHPFDWLCGWASSELEGVVHGEFDLVICGHVHRKKSEFVSRGPKGTVFAGSPALFTRKDDILGYSTVNLSDPAHITLEYRQWTGSNFVKGVMLAKNDEGVIQFPSGAGPQANDPVNTSPPSGGDDAIDIIRSDFEKNATCYSRFKGKWIDRQFSTIPEFASGEIDSVVLDIDEIISLDSDLMILAPPEFGLSSVGRQVSLRFALKTGRFYVYLDLDGVKPHQSAVASELESELARLGLGDDQVEGVVLDSFKRDKRSGRIVQALRSILNDKIRLICLEKLDDASPLGNMAHSSEDQADWGDFTKLYLWTLSRSSIRIIVENYGDMCSHIDDESLGRKVANDLEFLNLPRTPLNCLTLIKINESGFEESPVNRTEMINKVLSLTFSGVSNTLRYSSMPDMLDCESVLGYFSEFLIERKDESFTKREFFNKIDEYSDRQILGIESDVLFLILLSEGIIAKKDSKYIFRFSFWLYYFAAKRMHHSPEFAQFILGERTYAAYPLILEFYSGIDRRRNDAAEILVKDLCSMDEGLLSRTGIPETLNPYENAKWNPSADAIAAMEKEVEEGVAPTSLPSVLKDEIADRSYDRTRPYKQEIAHFIQDASLIEYVHAMQGAARVLRNSDHVAPETRKELLKCVLTGWTRIAQIMVVLSRVLAGRGNVGFEGVGFQLDENFKGDDETKWQDLMSAIPMNIAGWHGEDLYSKKLGPLFFDYLGAHSSGISGLLLRRVLVSQRPEGWQKHLENFIVNQNKNSWALSDLRSCLNGELRHGVTTERAKTRIATLSTMSLAKHITGKKKPDSKLLKKVGEKYPPEKQG